MNIDLPNLKESSEFVLWCKILLIVLFLSCWGKSNALRALSYRHPAHAVETLLKRCFLSDELKGLHLVCCSLFIKFLFGFVWLFPYFKKTKLSIWSITLKIQNASSLAEGQWWLFLDTETIPLLLGKCPCLSSPWQYGFDQKMTNFNPRNNW